MLSNILLCLVFFFYFVTAIYATETLDERNPMILWDPIPDAIRYQLEIRNENEEIILKEDVKETSYQINLEPGTYSHRVSAYNKFNKLSSYSEWYPFIIARSLAPEVTSEKKITSSKYEPEKIILIRGNNFSKNTFVSIKNKKETLPITSLKLKEGVFEVIIDNQNAKAGSYDLIMENPRKKKLVIKDYYILQDKALFTFPPNYPYWKEAGMSAILPGWGQVRKKQTYSAIFLDLALIASAGYYKSRLDEFKEHNNNYNESVERGILFQRARIPDAVLYGILSSETHYHKSVASAKHSREALNIVAAIYCINILDALLWKSSINTASGEVHSQFYTNLRMTPYINSNSLTVSPQFEFGFRVQY